MEILFWKKLGGKMNRLNFGSRPMLKDEPVQSRSYADLTRLFELTGWKPSYSIEKGIDSTIEVLFRALNEKNITV